MLGSYLSSKDQPVIQRSKVGQDADIREGGSRTRLDEGPP